MTTIDGRIARGLRTRDAVVDALLSLLEDGELRPTGAQIASRAGVSLRSVFQHFEDLETLFSALAARQSARIAAMRVPLPEGGPLDLRIKALVDEWARIYEFIAPVRRAAIIQEPFSATLRRGRDRLYRLGAAEVAAVFAPELSMAPPERSAALSAATSWDAWEHLRARQGLSVAAAKQVMGLTIRALLS